MDTGPAESNVGISARCVVVLWSWELSSGIFRPRGYVLTLLQVPPGVGFARPVPFSITGGVLYVWSICRCCAWPCPRTSAREQESGSIRAFDTVLSLILTFDWDRHSTAFYGNSLQINQSKTKIKTR
jgi:hypothetical protein